MKPSNKKCRKRLLESVANVPVLGPSAEIDLDLSEEIIRRNMEPNRSIDIISIIEEDIFPRDFKDF